MSPMGTQYGLHCSLYLTLQQYHKNFLVPVGEQLVYAERMDHPNQMLLEVNSIETHDNYF